MATDTPAITPAPNRRRLTPKLLAALLLVIIAGTAAGWWYTQKREAQHTAQQTTEALESASADDAQAIDQLKAAYDQAGTDEGRAKAAYYLAARYSALGNHEQSLRYYRVADRFYDGKDVNILLGVANEADATDEKSVAEEYYQKAIDFYKKQGSESNSEIIRVLEEKLNNL